AEGHPQGWPFFVRHPRALRPHGDQGDLHAPVRRASLLRVVAGDRTGFAGADGDHAVAHHAARVEVVGDRVGTLLRKPLVVAVGTDAVGMAGHLDDGLVVLLQRAG